MTDVLEESSDIDLQLELESRGYYVYDSERSLYDFDEDEIVNFVKEEYFLTNTFSRENIHRLAELLEDAPIGSKDYFIREALVREL